MTPGQAYNGKILPTREASARMVRISETQAGRRMDMVDDGAKPLVKRQGTVQPHARAKVARARQQVIFPAATSRPMPKAD